MAILDLSIAIEMFKEQHGRPPGETELPMIREIVLATGMMASPKAHMTIWEAHYNPPTPEGEVKWDEFALMGCLDGPQ